MHSSTEEKTKMICRITDEQVDNPWEGDLGNEFGLDVLSVYELMGEEHEVWLNRDSKGILSIEVKNESGELFVESDLHDCAAESLADFCKRYLRQYEKVKIEDAL
jgi:hypothetical protein